MLYKKKLLTDLMLLSVVLLLSYIFYVLFDLFKNISDNTYILQPVRLVYFVISIIIVILFSVYIYVSREKISKRNSSKVIILIGLFIALSIVSAKVSYMIPLFGSPALSISLGIIPLVIAGFIISPKAGAIVGAISDILSYFLSGAKYPFHPIFTVVSAVNGFVPGFIYRYMNIIKNKKIVKYIVIIIMSITYSVAIFYFVTDDDFITSLTKGSSLELSKNIIMIFILAIIIVSYIAQMIIYLKMSSKSEKSNKEYSYASVYVGFFVTFVITRYILTPLALYQLYSVPIEISIFLRIIKSTIELPIFTFLIYVLLNITHKGMSRKS